MISISPFSHGTSTTERRLIVIELTPPDSSVFGPLCPSERDVARQVALGRSNAEIAERRGSSPRTVANQIGTIFDTLAVQSRAELVRRAFGGRMEGGMEG
jgi:DNA-binding NarL/FixJ family response regulator